MNKIGVWDAATGQERVHLGRTRSVSDLAFTPDGRRLVSSEFDRPIRIWEIATNTEMGRLAGHEGVTLALSVSPDGRVVASGGSDGLVRLWDLASGKGIAA